MGIAKKNYGIIVLHVLFQSCGPLPTSWPTIYHQPPTKSSTILACKIVDQCQCVRVPFAQFLFTPQQGFSKERFSFGELPLRLDLVAKMRMILVVPSLWKDRKICVYDCLKIITLPKKPGLLSLLHRYNYQSYRCPLMSIKYPIFDPQQRATQTCQPEATWPSCSSPPTYPDASAPISSVAPSGRDERAARLRPAWSVPEKWWWDDSKTILEKIDVGKTAMLKLFTNINQLSYIWKHLAETSVNWEKKIFGVVMCLQQQCQTVGCRQSVRIFGSQNLLATLEGAFEEWSGLASDRPWDGLRGTLHGKNYTF